MKKILLQFLFYFIQSSPLSNDSYPSNVLKFNPNDKNILGICVIGSVSKSDIPKGQLFMDTSGGQHINLNASFSIQKESSLSKLDIIKLSKRSGIALPTADNPISEIINYFRERKDYDYVDSDTGPCFKTIFYVPDISSGEGNLRIIFGGVTRITDKIYFLIE